MKPSDERQEHYPRRDRVQRYRSSRWCICSCDVAVRHLCSWLGGACPNRAQGGIFNDRLISESLKYFCLTSGMNVQPATNTRKSQYVVPPLPYAMNALEPYISRETLEYHYGKHHRGYVNKLNVLIENTAFQDASLVEIVRKSSGAIFNNAAQVWNHNFYWRCMGPNAEIAGELHRRITISFGSVDGFKHSFKKMATEKFGAGWTWLIETLDGRLRVINTDDADNPLRLAAKPLLVCDVWEHAYYIDFRDDRARYVEAFWNVVNWHFVEQNLTR